MPTQLETFRAFAPADPYVAPRVAPPAYSSPAPVNPGSPARAYSPGYGGIPQVPNLIDVYGRATQSNQQFLPQFTQIGADVTGSQEQELLNNLRMALPGYDASVAQSMGNIGSLQRGEIPSDVRNQLVRQAAERGIATGLYDSPNSNAALLSALGQTSLGLQSEGEKQMSALVNRTPQAQPYDISRFFLNPSDLYESDLLANIYRAAPEPKAAAQQLISDQMAGYDMGRKNVPGFYGPSSQGSPYTPIVRNDPTNPPGVGALGPFGPTPAPYSPVMGNLQAGGGATAGLEWDPELGTYYNRFTGQYVGSPDEMQSNDWMLGGGNWGNWGEMNNPESPVTDWGIGLSDIMQPTEAGLTPGPDYTGFYEPTMY